MDGLAAALASKRVGFVRVDGGVDAVDRRAATARFRDDPEAWVALLSITAAGVGLDFSPAAAVVFAELPDEPALVAQAEARAHRRGAAAACINVYFLIARGTSDERRWRALDRGLARLAAVADGARGGRGGLAVHGVRDADAGVATPGGAAVEAAPPPPPPPPLPVQPPSHQAWPADPWWELSPHTGRLHAHGGPAGDAPLGLSAPLAELARGAGAAAAALAAAAAAPGGCGAPKFVTDSWAAAAAEAAGDVAEVRGAVRACLAGLVLRAPLAAEAAADAAAAAAGAVRGSTVRHDAPREPLPGVGVPPPGGALRSVSVARPRGGGVTVFTQVVDAAGKGLCLACGGLAPGTAAAPRPGAAVSSRSALFCAPSCDAEHATRTGGAAARRALFRVERGVCAACGLDAHALVAALRAVPRGGSGWLEQRLAVLQSLAPAFTGAAAARLASAAAAGHAWQADHTLAVHDGGGGCGLANLRTLCVPCHARVTAAQAGARAAAKRTRGGGGGGRRRRRPCGRGRPLCWTTMRRRVAAPWTWRRRRRPRGGRSPRSRRRRGAGGERVRTVIWFREAGGVVLCRGCGALRAADSANGAACGGCCAPAGDHAHPPITPVPRLTTPAPPADPVRRRPPRAGRPWAGAARPPQRRDGVERHAAAAA